MITMNPSRRSFLKAVGTAGLVTLLSNAGCKKKRHRRNFFEPMHTVFLENEVESWEDASQYIDNTLENGFAFDFTDITPNGLEFKDIRKTGDEYHALDAQGFTFDSEFNGQTKTFTINSLKWNERGVALSLKENSSTFDSCFDPEDDVRFTGLEHILNSETREKRVNANHYNGEIQNDAYFRIDASITNDAIILRRIEKIRIPDAKFQPVVTRYATSYDILIKNQYRQNPVTKSPLFVPGNNALGESFVFDFSSNPLEMRLEKVGQGISYKSFNRQFQDTGKSYMVRYFGIDTRKVFSNLEWNKFYPLNAIFTEILEAPQEIVLERNMPQSINLNGEDYKITLKGFIETERNFPSPDFIFEIEKDGKKEELRVKPLSHGYPNRALDINIDPNLEYYWGKDPAEVALGFIVPHRFFVSKNKFSSSVDFFDDNEFTGLKKILLPNFQQLTLANRFNGEIQDSFTRINAEFAIDYYRKNREDPENDAYDIVPAQGFDFEEQIQNGYILRIKRIDKFRISEM